MGILSESIKRKLQESFNPTHLEVIDESAKHSHHQGAIKHGLDGGGKESHFHVVIIVKSLMDLTDCKFIDLLWSYLMKKFLKFMLLAWRLKKLSA